MDNGVREGVSVNAGVNESMVAAGGHGCRDQWEDC